MITQELARLSEFAEPKRDRWGRPLITPPGKSEPQAYTRVSTLASTIDDKRGLQKWLQRQVVLGMAKRDDLVALARSAEPGDSKRLADIVRQAEDAAESKAAANTGTALHSYAELVDQGSAIADIAPAEHHAALEAYQKAMAPLKVILSERFVVVDSIRAAGSFDRLVELPDGDLVIADIKTGKDAPKYSLSAAAQMACYARGRLYNAATETRSNFPRPVNPDLGLMIHMPAGGSSCAIHKIDLRFGWAVAEMSFEVLEMRKFKPASLLWENHA